MKNKALIFAGLCTFTLCALQVQAINHETNPDLDEAQLTIYGALGSAFAKYDLNGNTGNKIIDLRGLNPGVYTYSVCSGKQIKTGKLVIVR